MIFRLAAKVEQWPRLLAHYRRVVPLAVRAEGRIVEMSAVRPHPLPFPVRWRAIQVVDAGTGTVRYPAYQQHSWGMEVEWHMETAGGSRSS